MDNMFTDNFKSFLNSLAEDKKECVYWHCVSNVNCPRKFVDEAKKIINEKDWNAFEFNYAGNRLPSFNDTEAEKLKDRMNTLDGTLLNDIISESLKKHKIFN